MAAPARGDPRRARALRLPRARRRAAGSATSRRRAGATAASPRPSTPCPDRTSHDRSRPRLPRRPRRSPARRPRLDEDLGRTAPTSRRWRRSRPSQQSSRPGRGPGRRRGGRAPGRRRSSSSEVDARLGTGARPRSSVHVERRRPGRARRRPRDRCAARPQAMLVAERTMLNVLSRLSGVATHTRRWADALEGTGAHGARHPQDDPGHARAARSTPCARGGGTNKRMGLYDVRDDQGQPQARRRLA